MVNPPGTVEQEILILVLGATGTGKSFFINTLPGQEKMEVGRGLESCTSSLDLGYMRVEGSPILKGYQIALVDTPGFVGSTHEDFEILNRIATWLKSSEAKLGGVIYLHDITISRFDGGARRNLRLLQNLCGDEAIGRLALVTTKWGFGVSGSRERHEQLRTTHWKHLINKEAAVYEFHDTYDSAWNIVKPIVVDAIQRGPSNLILQGKTIDPKKSTSQTNSQKSARNTFKSGFIQPFAGLFRKKVIFRKVMIDARILRFVPLPSITLRRNLLPLMALFSTLLE